MCAVKIRRVKASFGRDPWDSAKERGHKSYAFVNIQKADFLAVCIVKSPWAQEAPPHILASAAVRTSAPGTRVRLCQRISETPHEGRFTFGPRLRRASFGSEPQGRRQSSRSGRGLNRPYNHQLSWLTKNRINSHRLRQISTAKRAAFLEVSQKSGFKNPVFHLLEASSSETTMKPPSRIPR